MEGLVVLGSPGKDSATIVDVSVDDDEDGGIGGARDLEFAQVALKLDVAQGEEELSVIVVKDLVRDAGSVDAAKDLDVRTIVGRRMVAGSRP